MKKANGNQIVDFLAEKWSGANCPLCGNNEWHASNKYFELREFNDRNIVLGGPNNAIIPVIPVTCSKCGNTVFINAITTGLIKE